MGILADRRGLQIYNELLKDEDCDIEKIKKILKKKRVNVNVKNKENGGLTSLHLAVLKDNVEAVKLLIKHGADVNAKNLNGKTPLNCIYTSNIKIRNGWSSRIKLKNLEEIASFLGRETAAELINNEGIEVDEKCIKDESGNPVSKVKINGEYVEVYPVNAGESNVSRESSIQYLTKTGLTKAQAEKFVKGWEEGFVDTLTKTTDTLTKNAEDKNKLTKEMDKKYKIQQEISEKRKNHPIMPAEKIEIIKLLIENGAIDTENYKEYLKVEEELKALEQKEKELNSKTIKTIEEKSKTIEVESNNNQAPSKSKTK